jgi:hypothetical protein
MCKVKIHLFELSTILGFTRAAQTVLSSQKNNFLFQFCPRAPLPVHAAFVEPSRRALRERGAQLLLDIFGERSVSVFDEPGRLRLAQFLPPPAPFGLRGVVVVQREGALRPREELT